MDSLIVFGAKYLFVLVLLGSLGSLIPMNLAERKRFVLQALVTAVVSIALTKGAGAVYNDPRPFTQGVHALIPHEPDNGFPSDHTVLSFCAALLTLCFSRRLAIALIPLAGVVGACRVLSGVHHTLDVLAGIGIAAASVGVTAWGFTRFAVTAKPSNEPV